MPDYPHFVLPAHGKAEPYTSPGGGGGGKFESPPRDRARHSEKLLSQYQQVRKDAEQQLGQQPATADLHHVPLVFVGTDDLELNTERLGNKTKGIKVINVKQEGDRIVATVAVPKDSLDHFEQRINEYRSDTKKSGGPRHEELITSIQEIRLAALRDYYTDSDGVLPRHDEALWWEVWLDTNENADAVAEFRQQAQQQQLLVSENTVTFPEVAVVLARTSLDQWSQFPQLLNLLAELRRASIVPSEFIQLTPKDQAEFVDALRKRTTFAGVDAPVVCLLDTGVNRGHRLLSDALSEDDTQTWNPKWGVNDRKGHGTELAGLALYGPLEGLLLDDSQVVLAHRLESVKILPDDGANDAPDYGPITFGSMALAETQAPTRQRTYCLSVTADDRDQGLPTLWSSAIDQASSGAEDEQRRLLVVSAGNLRSGLGVNYPTVNHEASTQDPAQSWNSLTVGGCTSKVWMQEDGYEGWQPLAKKGTLSPSSTTSLAWEEQNWPYKPDIVYEGGNYAHDASGDVSAVDDLGLLTTLQDPSGAQLKISGDTSAAAAQVARMAAILQSDYPDFRPETIRALLVHSAEWTPEMLEEFPYAKRENRLRCYGYGIPNLERARACAKNLATMVFEDSLQPFRLEGSDVKTNEMKLHALALPQQVLQGLGNTKVRMRVTLSYFIEPSPGRNVWKHHQRYASHGLRFDVLRPDENLTEFRRRLTRDVWDDRQKHPGGTVKDSRKWEVGDTLRRKGSLHSDTWSGVATELALSDQLVVYPVTGWWRERRAQERYDREARYSLIVSIETDSSDVALYTAVQQVIETPVTVSVLADS